MADQNSSLMEHLEELRVRLMKSLWIVAIGCAIAYSMSELIFDFIRLPIAKYLGQTGLVFTSPADKFLAHVKVSLFAGTVLTVPFWMYQLWKFVSPALYEKERNYAVGFICVGSSLFLAGVSFCYFVILPAAFNFLLGFGGTVDQPMITIDGYLSFFLGMSIMFGLSFELPLIIVVLAMLGLVSAQFLREKRRFAVIILAIFSAVATPTPDAFSLFAMLIPLIIFYEGSILAVSLVEKKRTTSPVGTEEVIQK